MEGNYREAFNSLNERQRQAVETIDGPVLVIAGPGTGKTQLVSTRVGYILQNTDTPADGILLLTFTEAGVEAMRERLLRLIGKPAYDVQLSTYHAFGGMIFRQYPDYFEGAQLSLIEELSADVLLRQIIAKLPYSDPLKFADNYINDLKSFISDAKRALLTPEDVAWIAADNLKFIKHVNRTAKRTFENLSVTVSKKSVPAFEELQALLAAYPAAKLPDSVLPLSGYAQGELAAALEHFSQSEGKTSQLTGWKRRWLAKDEAAHTVLDGEMLNRRLAAAANIYDKYQQSLSRQNLYDYDDMILRAIDTLQAHPELKYSLAERYNYIMLDEFQDTNPAQFRLVQLLTDHPVNEGRPNVLAVGDDDQAIYAFQGAEHANMAAFARHYRNVKIISLEQNYRSHTELLETSKQIAEQIGSRLHHDFPGVRKELAAAADLPEPPKIEARRFLSDAAQYEWVAKEIKRLTEQGIPAGQVAVLAPKHRYLVPLLPYLTRQGLAVRYERRENVLDEPLVHQLERMSQLVLALAGGDETTANAIWPEVLSYDFWQVPPDKIWRINWQVRQSHEPWTAQLLNDDLHGNIGSFFLKLASLLPVTTLEQQLDALLGVPESSQQLKLPYASPMYDYYFSADSRGRHPQDFTKLISDLNVLRSRLRDWRRSQTAAPGLRDFIEFTEGHRAAKLNVLNTSPYNETEEAVNLLTAYGSKGREFQAVFLIAALDEVWGSASRNQGYRLGLPANLSYIRYQGASEDERLRLLYVAATRARTRLYLTYFSQDLAGKRFTPLKYMDISEADDQLFSRILPAASNKIIAHDQPFLEIQAAANYWQQRHMPPFSQDLRQALAPRLQSYKLNPTDLNKFLDIVNAGPESFFMGCFLRFPQAPSPISAYGTAIHNTLRFIGRIFLDEGRPPAPARAEEILQAQLARIELDTEQQAALLERGRPAIRQWLAQQAGSLQLTDWFEYNFQSEGSSAGIARLSGVTDRLQIDEKTRRITVIDYKVGQSYKRWAPGVIKLYNYRRQLLFYKLLIESSARFRKYQVGKAFIEFVEPDENGNINRLELQYDETELQRLVDIINAVWARLQNLQLPDVSRYPLSEKGIRRFEDDLINENAASV